METMPISKFKATCLAAIERVRRTGLPLRITRFGKPLAEIVPAKPEVAKRRLGGMAGTFHIAGDIMAPLDVKWDALDDSLPYAMNPRGPARNRKARSAGK